MTIFSAINQIDPIINEIEMNFINMDQHDSNANMINTGSAATYLLTSNSRSSTVRNVGQLAAIGGFIYGNSERNKAYGFRQKNALLISQVINIIELHAINVIRLERDVNVIRKFLELNLKVGKQLDRLILYYIPKFKKKGHLGKSNINLFFNLNTVDVFDLKIRMNRIFFKLDANKNFQHIESNFLQSKLTISLDKVYQEGLYTRIGLIALLCIGFFIGRNNEQGNYLILVAAILWGLNHFFPFFPETKKLIKSVRIFLDDIKSTCGISSINFK